jgi:hypothetical protein
VSAPLRWMPPSVTEFVIVYLGNQFGATTVGAERPVTTPANPSPLPYRMVNRVSGHDDKVFESSIVSVHTFADNMEDAEAAAYVTHSWMLALGPPLVGQTPVTISNDQVVMADCVETMQSPIWVDYEDTNLRRFVARYEIGLRFVSVA